MASNGTQSGFGDAPAFPEEDALQIGGDLEEVARYARLRGNVPKGTTAARDAYTDVTNGLLWSNTTDGTLERYNGTSWDVIWRRVNWTTISATNDWTANTGAVSPQVAASAETAFWRGGMFGGSTGNAAGTLPVNCRPSRTTRVHGIMLSNNTDAGRARIEPNGQIFFSGSLSQDASFSWPVI